MAAESKTRQGKFSTTVLTLPVSCQICLGTVKQPVLCSNCHVFCGACIDVWLQRSHQCPTCRVPIDHTNPVKRIRGGFNQAEAEEEMKSTPEMRRTRFDLLYREYEDTLEQLHHEVKILKTDNSVLKSRLSLDQVTATSSGSTSGVISNPDGERLHLLTKKLQDAQKLYERVKQDINKLKQENNNLKEENVNLVRENAKLKEEVSSRSPHRYGRITVATLEAQRKEVQRLTMALERSDKYIEGLLQQLQGDQDFTKHKTHNQATSVHTAALPHCINDLGVTDGSTAKDQKYHSDTRLLNQDFPELHVDQVKEGNADSVADQKHQVKRQLFKSESLRGMEFTTTKDDVQSRYSGTKSMMDIHDTFSSPKTDTSFGIKPCSEVIPEEPTMKKADSSFRLDSTGKGKTPAKKVQFSLTGGKSSNTSSFDLDMPSPLAPSSLEWNVSVDKLSMKKMRVDSSSKCLPEASEKFHWAMSSPQRSQRDSCMDNFTRKENANDEVEKMPSLPNDLSSKSFLQKWKVDACQKGQFFEQNSSSCLSEPDCLTPQSVTGFDKKASLSEADIARFTKRGPLPTKSRNGTAQEKNVSIDLEGPSLDDTQTIQTELNDLDISVTPELSDCLKLLNRAEKKIYNTDCPTHTTYAGTLNSSRVCNSQNEVENAEMIVNKSEGSVHAAGIGLGRGNVHMHAHFSQTYVPGTTGTMSGWEHGFFSGLRVNPYKRASLLAPLAATKPKDEVIGTVFQAGQALSTDHEKMLLTSNEPDGEYGRATLQRTAGSNQSSTASVLPPSVTGSTLAVLSHTRPLLKTWTPSSTASSSAGHHHSAMSSQTQTLPQFSLALSSAGGAYTESSLPSVSSISAGLSPEVLNTQARNVDSVLSHRFVGQSHVRSTCDVAIDQGKPGSREMFANRNYSYISNASSLEGTNMDSKDSDLPFPEPKKRLFDFDFESEDEFGCGSPSKTTKIL